MHTNLDNIHNGVNAKITNILELQDSIILAPKANLLRQLVVYCPCDYSANLKTVLFENGAGSIGHYSHCSFSLVGEGTFRPKAGSKPFRGKIGGDHIEKEDRIEVIYSKDNEESILRAMQHAHPYQEVAYQIYSIENKHNMIGAGMIGDLKDPIKTDVFLNQIKSKMNTECIRYSKIIKDKVKRVAVCGGSGSFLLQAAKKAGADIFITSDFKYHEFFDAEEEIVIVDVGHYESEQFTKDIIYDLLTKKFTKFAIQLSKVNTNPIKYL